MTHPISILVYPLFNGWRAECRACGAYGNSEDSKYHSHIAMALENLSNNQNAYSEKCKTCAHQYGNYKPRVSCFIDYKNLPFIKESFRKDGDAKFPRIIIDNKINLDVFNAKDLTHEWSAYSYNRHIQKQELKAKEEKAFNMAFDKLENIVSEAKDVIGDKAKAQLHNSISETKQIIDSIVEDHKIANWQYILYTIMVAITVLLMSVVVGAIADVGGCRALLLKLSEGCLYKLCL